MPVEWGQKEPRWTDLTVLVTDIRESTDKVNNCPPELLAHFMYELHQLTQNPLSDVCEGDPNLARVNVFLGDGFLVLFQDREDEHFPEGPRRAIDAAARMQHRYEALTHTTEYSQRQFDATSLVAGISFGGVIYGAFDGTGERSTAVGRLVNLAFRLAQVAEHGQIVVSEEVQQHASAKLTAFEFTPGTLPMEAKGFEGRPYYLARAQ